MSDVDQEDVRGRLWKLTTRKASGCTVSTPNHPCLISLPDGDGANHTGTDTEYDINDHAT